MADKTKSVETTKVVGTGDSILKIIGEISQTVGGAAGIISLLQILKPVAEGVVKNVAPEVHAKIKRDEQKDANGPVDEINFAHTKELLDGDPANRHRPLKANLESFLKYLEYMNKELRMIFVDFYGRSIADDNLRFLLLKQIAEVRDPQTNRGDTMHANHLRFEQLFYDGVLRTPESLFKRLGDRHPEIGKALSGIPDALAEFGEARIAELNNTLAPDGPVDKFTTSMEEKAKAYSDRAKAKASAPKKRWFESWRKPR